MINKVESNQINVIWICYKKMENIFFQLIIKKNMYKMTLNTIYPLFMFKLFFIITKTLLVIKFTILLKHIQ